MELEDRIAYGPVWSRRFGWDVGINLLPTDRKLCTFDCVYCQYGFTPPLQNGGLHFPESKEVVRQWKLQLEQIWQIGLSVRHTTVSGNGEPTMHPHFSDVAFAIKKWRDSNAPEIRIAVLSNGYRIYNPEIRKALELFDEPVIKFDAAIQKKFEQIDQPLKSINLLHFIGELKKFKNLQLQTMFLKGWNDGDEDLEAWRAALAEIKPLGIQIYTIARDTAVPGLCAVSRRELQRIASDSTKMLNIPVKAFV